MRDGESIFKVGESDDVLDEIVTVDLYLNQGLGRLFSFNGVNA